MRKANIFTAIIICLQISILVALHGHASNSTFLISWSHRETASPPDIPRWWRAIGTSKLFLPHKNATDCRKLVRNTTDFDSAYDWRRSQELPDYFIDPSVCNWPRDKPMSKQDWDRLQYSTMYEITGEDTRRFNATVRYKLYDGVLYMHGSWIDERDMPYSYSPISTYGPVFEEMLLLANHMYELPDLDLVVDLGDSPSPTTSIPTLSLTLLSNGPATGCAIPYNAWQKIAASKEQLQDWMKCLDTRYPLESKIPKVVFRGATTGEIKMHPNISEIPREWQELWRHPEKPPKDWKSLLLFNPRVLAAVISRNLPWMDVKVTDYHWEWHSPIGRNASSFWWSPTRIIEQTFNVSSETLKEETFSQYAGSLVIEAHGFQQRLPEAMVSGSVVLLQERPEQDWFEHLTQDGIHFQTFRHDMADMTLKALKVAEDYQNKQEEGWENMVAAARAFALEHFTARAMIDAFVWSVLNYKVQYIPWRAEKPDLKKWRPVNHTLWVNPFISDEVRYQVEGWNPVNHPEKKGPTLLPFKMTMLQQN